LLEPRPTPKLEDHPLSGVRDCLFNTFAATLHTGGRSFTRNLKTPHAVVTGTHLSRGYREVEKHIGTVFNGRAVLSELLDFWRWDRQYLPKCRKRNKNLRHATPKRTRPVIRNLYVLKWKTTKAFLDSWVL